MTKRRYGQALVSATAALAMAGGASIVARAQETPLKGDEEAGAEIYAVQCKGCHTVSIAPTLRGVSDRPIASVATFGGYTAALKAKGGDTWSVENLDAFLTAPAVFAPGTTMVVKVPDAQARADVIAYIRALPPPRSPP